jgi:predicted transcriptional regulator
MDDARALEYTTADLPTFMSTVHKALVAADRGEPEPEPLKAPAISLRRSVQPDYIVCLEDGLRFESLGRHLRTRHDLSPGEYRVKWGLPDNYPMIAENYSAFRSALAKSIGFGTRNRKGPVAAKPPRKRATKAARGTVKANE